MYSRLLVSLNMPLCLNSKRLVVVGKNDDDAGGKHNGDNEDGADSGHNDEAPVQGMKFKGVFLAS